MEQENGKGSEEIIEMYCELCKKKSKSRSADGFCVDCVRYFCTECLAYHTEFLPDHTLKDKKSMPQDVCLQQCPEHRDQIIKFYCTSCNKFFCSLCKKKNHDNCKSVSHLPLLVNQLEEGEEFKKFSHELDMLANKIKSIESTLEDEHESVEMISEAALSCIESARQKFIDWLDKGVEIIKAEVQAIKEKDQNVIKDDTSKLIAIKEEVQGVKSSVKQLLIEKKRCKLFMAMKDAQRKQRKFFDDLQGLKNHSKNSYEFELMEGSKNCIESSLPFGRLSFIRPEESTKMEDNRATQGQENTACGKKQAVNIDTEIFPGVETQNSCISNLLQRPLIEGETWYVLDMIWFKQWKAYVGYESWDHFTVGEESIHPGPIDNTPILQEGSDVLKEHLIDDLDYALVPEEGWEKLVTWYGMLEDQKLLPRKVIKEGVYTKSLKVEVYTWWLKLYENSDLENQITRSLSRSNTVGELEQIMRREFNIAADKEVRLWNRYMTNMYEQLTVKDRTLQDAGLYQGQVIVVEQRNQDGTWPRT